VLYMYNSFVCTQYVLYNIPHKKYSCTPFEVTAMTDEGHRWKSLRYYEAMQGKKATIVLQKGYTCKCYADMLI
jgi:hypothetical protein